jgi:hypothetical protein
MNNRFKQIDRLKFLTKISCFIILSLGLMVPVYSDTLYIGDVADDSIKRFDAETGEYLGVFVASGSGGLFGPRGIIFHGSHLLVVNQNVGQPFPGEVLDFDKRGTFTEARVPSSDLKAPFAPRGMVLGRGNLYVADMGDADYVIGGGAAPNPLPARLAQYDQEMGVWERDLDYAGFAMSCTDGECTQWSPRAVVFGPDGALYVSAQKFVTATNPNTLFGRILRFPRGGRGPGEVLVDGETCGCGLARPEGLTFGPDGKLYVTSFRINAADNDKILVFSRRGRYQGKIDLYLAGQQPRAFAQALTFGPGGRLYVPISGGGPDAGSVRRYDVSTKTYDTIIASGGDLISGWYLTFGETDPSTLEYDD